jgi:hypothetical protein
MALPPELTDRIQQLADGYKALHGLLGERLFDDLAIHQQLAARRKLAAGRYGDVRTVCLAHNLRHALPVNAERHYTHLPKDFLEGDLTVLPDRCVYLLLNNDIGRHLPQYVELVRLRPDCLFVVWDWDSQHWLQMSCRLAAHSDFYVPSTSENLYTLSHFNPNLLGPAYAAVNQWSRRFVVDHLDLLLKERSDAPFGPHVRYDGFDRRNRAVATLNRSFPAIGFTDHGYQGKSDLDNLIEWAGHKAHWIVPVLGGVPIRIYNCLLTGGIAVAPSHYRQMPENRQFDPGHVVHYDVIDLVEPAAVQQRAVAAFDAAGRVGVAERVGRALGEHHIDTRIETVLLELEARIRQLQGA